MGKAQSRLAILIIFMTTINAMIFSSLLNGSGTLIISTLTFGFVLISEYLLTKQDKINEYGKNGKAKYFKLFNNKIISNNIINKTF